VYPRFTNWGCRLLKPSEERCVEVGTEDRLRKKNVAKNIGSLLAAVLVSSLLIVGCTSAKDSEAEQAAVSERSSEQTNGGSSPTEEPTNNGQRADAGAVARAGDAVARAGTNGRGAVARAGSAGEKEDGISSTTRRHEEATLKVEGSSGTEFSGTCAVGGEESEISGGVPQSFRYELHGRQLDCKITKKSSNPGVLRVVLNVGDHTNSVHETSAEGGTITLRYESNGVVSFSSSASGSGGKGNSFSE
jgi:hypothetical protein